MCDKETYMFRLYAGGDGFNSISMDRKGGFDEVSRKLHGYGKRRKGVILLCSVLSMRSRNATPEVKDISWRCVSLVRVSFGPFGLCLWYTRMTDLPHALFRRLVRFHPLHKWVTKWHF